MPKVGGIDGIKKKVIIMPQPDTKKGWRNSQIFNAKPLVYRQQFGLPFCS